MKKRQAMTLNNCNKSNECQKDMACVIIGKGPNTAAVLEDVRIRTVPTARWTVTQVSYRVKQSLTGFAMIETFIPYYVDQHCGESYRIWGGGACVWRCSLLQFYSDDIRHCLCIPLTAYNVVDDRRYLWQPPVVFAWHLSLHATDTLRKTVECRRKSSAVKGWNTDRRSPLT